MSERSENRRNRRTRGSAATTGDVRDLLGMNTRTAHLVAGFFMIALAAQVAVAVNAGSSPLPSLVVLLVVALAGLGLLALPDDPLPVWYAVAVTVGGPLAAYASFVGTPLPLTRPEQTWQFGAFTAIATYMCVRGRADAAWLLMCLVVLAAMVWTLIDGDGAAQGLSIGAINFGPLFMATLFAFTIRPAAASIYELRRRAVERNAAQEAALAAVAEHDKQMRALNQQVRPMLERIAAPTPLTDDERRQCLALEAQLRDALRAPVLARYERTAVAAARARDRGVTVVMVDSHGLDDIAPTTRESVLERLADALDTVTGGSIVIRVLPPGRELVATAVIDPAADATGPDSALRATRLEFAAS